MAPPPEENNGTDDPLGGMDPLKWLESLAARQGANAEEFVTEANLEVPEADPDAVIDEPGYVPSEPSSRDKFEAEQRAEAEAAAASVEPEPTLEPAMAVPDSIEEPVPATPGDGDSLDADIDPLKWLESLAKRQGADAEEFVTAANLEVPEADSDAVIDEPGYVPSEPSSREKFEAEQRARAEAAAASVEPEPTPEPAMTAPDSIEEPVLAAPGDESPLDADIDPLKWLESLAKRQGANAEEFVTAANLEVPEADSDAVIDEPGYVPSEPSSREKFEAEQRARAEAEAAAASVEPEIPPTTLEPELTLDEANAILSFEIEELAIEEEFAPATPLEPVADELFAGEVVNPIASEVDPVSWLETLAKRQGADPEELITDADLNVPVPVDPVIDEPGYRPYSPFGAPEVSEPAEAEVSPAAPPPPEPEPAGADGTLAWLEGLAEQSGSTQPVAAQPVEDVPPEPVVEAEAPVLEPAAGLDEAVPLAGMDREELELKAARGELSPEQMTAWLGRHAEDLVQTRGDAEQAAAISFEDLAPAEPAEVPDWLLESKPSEDAVPAEPAPISESIIPPPTPEGLPDWLESDAPSADVDPELMELFAAAVPDEVPDETQPAEAVPSGMLEEEPVLDGVSGDSWAQALDHEFMTPEERVPDWYTRRITDPTLQAQIEAEAAAAQAQIEAEAAATEEVEVVEEALPELEAADVPDWLSPPEDAAELEPADVPDWLTEQVGDTTEADIVDWLQEQEIGDVFEAEAAPAEVLDWLDEATPELEPADMPGWLTEAIPEVAEAAATEPALDLAPDIEPVEVGLEVSAAEAAALLGLDASEMAPEVSVEMAPAEEAPVVEEAPPVVAEPAAPTPTPQPVAPPPPVALEPVAYTPSIVPAQEPLPVTLPEGDTYANYRASLEQDPDDHATRLELARTLVQADEIGAGLGQYLVLTRLQGKLDDSAEDLVKLAEAHPGTPQVFRVLGDVQMRQGRLQDALDTFRKALDQL